MGAEPIPPPSNASGSAYARGGEVKCLADVG